MANWFLSEWSSLLNSSSSSLGPIDFSSSLVITIMDLYLPYLPLRRLKGQFKGFKKWKAPGSNGFPAEFYPTSWPIINDDLVHVIQKLFITEFLPSQMNHTLLLPIPKIQSATSVSDFRPISLCNVAYKIISKLLAKRWRPLIKKCVSEKWGAFIPES